MPTYSYRCPKCGHEYERFQKISDSSRARCPKCKARGERQITGGAGIVFKGSGFYVTDYKRAGEKTADAGKGIDNKPADNKPADKKPAESGSTGRSREGGDS